MRGRGDVAVDEAQRAAAMPRMRPASPPDSLGYRRYRVVSLESLEARSASETLPGQIDTHRMAPCTVPAREVRNYLGSLDWSPAWQRYIKGARPRSVQEVCDLRRAWWQNDYLLDRVVSRLGPVITGALLAWLRDDVHYGTVTQVMRRGPGWLQTQQRAAARIVADYLPDNRPING